MSKENRSQQEGNSTDQITDNLSGNIANDNSL